MIDYINSFPSLQQAINVIVDVIQLVNSNSHEILKYTTQELPSSNETPNQTPIEQMLEILWDPEKDVLQVKIINKEVPNIK